jgi:CheY-like chemotaxis protein
MNSPESAVILLVEDQEDDIFLIRKAFAKAGLSNPIYVVRNGEEAVAYLMGDRPFTNRSEYPLPDLILLDLKMPRLDGFETLSWIRRQPGIRSIPVVVLTSSEELRDVNRAYSLGANSFLVKRMDFENSIQLSRTIHEFWIKASKRPETFRPSPQPTPLAQDGTLPEQRGVERGQTERE